MHIRKWSTRAAVLVIAMLTGLPAWPDDGHTHGGQHGAQRVPVAPSHRVAVSLSDTVLTDQDGREVRLLSDIVADKVAIVTFVYTNCTATCPIVSHTFSQLQDKLGEMLDSSVRLVSLSVDPERDTPNKLKAYSAANAARSGWSWLTGVPANVNQALKEFGAYRTDFERHPAMVMIGDGRTGKWTRVYDIDDAQRLMDKTQDVLATRASQALAAAGKE